VGNGDFDDNFAFHLTQEKRRNHDSRYGYPETGWANHFWYGVSKAVFSAVDDYAWNWLMRWTGPGPSTRASPNRAWQRCGVASAMPGGGSPITG
jgi:hypothetical protein